VEWRIYFLFPILIYSFRKWGGVATSGIILISSVGVWAVLKYFTPFNASPWGINPHYLGLFALGMLAASVAFSKNRSFGIMSKPALLVTIATGLLGLACYTYDYKWGLWIAADLAVGVGCACLLIGVSSGKLHGLNKALSWKPLAFTGTFAYSIYLVHAPLLEVFSRYILNSFQLSNTLYVTFLIIVGVPLTVAMSYLFFLVAEKPFISRKASPTTTSLPEKAMSAILSLH
jgi:peptidoglycan/LPS O-acetylase OafA/YrhL